MAELKESPTLADAVTGQAVGWAVATAAIVATGGTAGWTQSPAWSAGVGLSLAALALFLGAWRTDRSRIEKLSRRRFAATSWSVGFLLACGLLKMGLLGESFLSPLLAAGVTGLVGGVASGLLGDFPLDSQRYGHGFAWALAFAVGLLIAVLGGYLGGDLFELVVRRVTGSAAAGTVALVFAWSATGGLGGAVAGFIAGLIRD